MREFGSEFEITYGHDSYFETIENRFHDYAYTRTGREAITMAAKSIGVGAVLMPAYCCWSMDQPIESKGWSVSYYRLKEDLSVDWDYLKGLILLLKPKAVLLMNFFGFTPTKDIVNLIKGLDFSIVIIEDFTHCLFSFNAIYNPLVDYYVASIRKSLGVPDGGVVYTNHSIEKEKLIEKETPFYSIHKRGGMIKSQYLFSHEAGAKQAYRSLQTEAKDEADQIIVKKELYAISDLSKSIIYNTSSDYVRFARRTNYQHLYELISSNTSLSILYKPSDLNDAPFMMPILSENRDEFQHRLAKEDVYCQVLWPLSINKRNTCEIARKMEAKMLAIPIDQRYDYYDIEEMGQRINSIQ